MSNYILAYIFICKWLTSKSFLPAMLIAYIKLKQQAQIVCRSLKVVFRCLLEHFYLKVLQVVYAFHYIPIIFF